MTQEQIAQKQSILLVDDEQDSLSIFARYLSEEGYFVHAFSSPVMAIEHYRYTPSEYSLVISDVRMPKMDGFQLAKKVKELNPSVKVILTSSFEVYMPEFERLAQNSPVDGFLDKPITLKKLSELVKQQIHPQ